MRACTQCGLSISETATFCAVCGTRADAAPEVAATPAPEVAAAPVAEVTAAPAPVVAEVPVVQAPEVAAATLPESPDEPVVQAPEVAEAQAPEVAEVEAPVEPPPAAAPAPQAPAVPVATKVDTQAPGAAEGPPSVPETAATRRRREASLPMVDAERLEKTEPLRSVALYRQAIIGLLESAADPLEHEGVRRDLLQIFDRLSVVLKRAGLQEAALEEIDCAASLGLLDCQDQGIKGHREALKKRRESLQRSLDGRPAAAT